jgi:hypothetical protein
MILVIFNNTLNFTQQNKLWHSQIKNNDDNNNNNNYSNNSTKQLEGLQHLL